MEALKQLASMPLLYVIFYAYIYTMLKDKNDIDNFLQESYIQIFKNLGKLENPSSFYSWGTSICRNVTLFHLRTAKRHWGKAELRPPVSDEEYEGMAAIPASSEYGDSTDRRYRWICWRLNDFLMK